jgi:hypothetical protein
LPAASHLAEPTIDLHEKKMTKKIIFITGASHSGSTLVGCILGAQESTPFTYFHIGEVHAFFDKKHKNFGNPRAAGKTGLGRIWSEIDYHLGYDQAHMQIFNKAGSRVIIDSSKSMKRFEMVRAVSEKNNWSLFTVIAYRPFAKIWESDARRQVREARIKKNINTYRSVKKQIIEAGFDYAIVDIEQLILSPGQITRSLCHAAGIPYFEGKENYWHFPSCHLYGSATQRRHLNRPEQAGYDISKVRIAPEIRHPFLEREDVRELDRFFSDHALKQNIIQTSTTD